jgi:hypothetical protein
MKRKKDIMRKCLAFGAAASENEARYVVAGSGLHAAGCSLYWLEDG